jgi:GntR family transcriptional regulator
LGNAALKLKVDPHSDTPICDQLVDAIIAAIETRQLEKGDKLPSVRSLSAQLDINPNTTAKVYRELELRGFIEGKTGSGCYVRQVDEKAARGKVARMQELFAMMLVEAKSRRIEEGEFLEFVKARTRK